jgi:hypothetical protein
LLNGYDGLVELIGENEMTPTEKLGYKIGDRFVASGTPVFTDGSIIELEYDDNSRSPLFKLINGDCKYNKSIHKSAGGYCHLKFVKKKKLRKQKGQHTNTPK